VRVKIDPLDRLASECVRRRAIVIDGGCQRCLTPKYDIEKEDGSIYPAWKQLQTSHFIGRSNKAVRYDLDNLVGICAGCHIYLTAHPLEHVEWFKQHLGDRFEMLQGRQHQTGKVDRNAIYLYLKEQIRILSEL